MIPAAASASGSGWARLVVGDVDPAHASVATDVADVVDGEPQEREVTEVDVVRGRRIRLEVAGAGDVALVVADRGDQSEQGDASAGEGIGTLRDRLREQQARTRVTQRVLRVFRHRADEEQRVTVVGQPEAHDRAERVAGGVGRQGRERAPAFTGDQRAAPFGVARLPCRRRRGRGRGVAAGGRELVLARSFHRATLGQTFTIRCLAAPRPGAGADRCARCRAGRSPRRGARRGPR